MTGRKKNEAKYRIISEAQVNFTAIEIVEANTRHLSLVRQTIDPTCSELAVS